MQKKPAAALQDLFEWQGKVNFLFSSGFSIEGYYTPSRSILSMKRGEGTNSSATG
ncbi:hypothetical protein LCL90_11695 [Bacillus infantis]|uniref:hypothetical protein n=1 Tax=Bacillus infantis TaxID=324767 RepID=UPI001CD5AE1C|nr:hypothetical protein [Bacillus infantis]MCA1035294.1 hypothetical protein [Bacillus infantis]